MMTNELDVDAILGDNWDYVMDAVGDACGRVGLVYKLDGEGNLDADDFSEMTQTLMEQIARAMVKAGLT